MIFAELVLIAVAVAITIADLALAGFIGTAIYQHLHRRHPDTW